MEVTIEAVTADFDRWVAGYVRAYPGEQGKALRNVALNFITRVVPRTPVDTGRARGGWLPFAVTQRPEFRALAGSGAPTASQGKVQQGMDESSYKADLKGADQYIELTNGVPYITLLEYGRSKQAGAGMVRVAMRELIAGGEVDQAFEDAVEAANRKADG